MGADWFEGLVLSSFSLRRMGGRVAKTARSARGEKEPPTNDGPIRRRKRGNILMTDQSVSLELIVV
eukprot:307510-Prorocentrum_minimum.AAC.1